MPELQAECHLPVEIVGGEKIVRAIKANYHLKKGLPTWRAFKPGPEKSVVSVIRQEMGDDFCKDKSREVAAQHYVGLLVCTAAAIRGSGSSIEDYRADFCGHAHLDHGIVSPRGEPLPAADSEKLRQKCEAILVACDWHPDPSPEQPGWSGAPL